MFKDRNDAGKRLASLLGKYKDSDAIVFALPRGGVVIGYEISRVLNLPLELVITRKISRPNYPEYAIGAVSETGKYIISEREENIDEEWLEQEIHKEKMEAIRRRMEYYSNRIPLSIKNKIVIIVDDGVATGLSLSLAIGEIKSKEPKYIVIAVPVISKDVADSMSKICDKLIAFETIDDNFGSVGSYYKNFHQVSD